MIFFSVFTSVFSQETQNSIFIKKQNTYWKTFLKNTEKTYNLKFFYNPDSLPDINIIVKKDSSSLVKTLKYNYLPYDINISKDNLGNYFIYKNFAINSNIDNIFNNTILKNKDKVQIINSKSNYLKVYKNFISKTIIIGTKKERNKNDAILLNGFVKNILTKAPIQQSQLKIIELNKSISSNSNGYYEFYLKPGNYTLSVQSLGMYDENYKINIYSKGKLNIFLKTKSIALDEVTISAIRNNNTESTKMGFEKITAKTIKHLPSIMGEPDIIKVALLLPGVQSIGELSSGFNVRGSPADQNMFYINKIPVYNPTHIFGLFSAFNSDAVSDFTFYKGNIPVEYGGSLSSVFDIGAKRGNLKYFSARGGIGITSSRLMAEGPIKKDTASYLISLRTTYSDWILRQIKNIDIKNSTVSFKDALMNFSYNINKKNTADVFIYGSHDFANLAFGLKNEYTNLGAAIKWAHTFNKKFNSELNIIKSQYSYKEENYEITYLSNKHSFELNHNELKLSFKYLLTKKNSLKFGINSKYYKLNFGDFLPLSDASKIKPIEFESEQAINNSIFLGNNWEITDKLTLDAGIRVYLYSYLGPKTVYTYEENSAFETDNITDTTRYNKNDLIKNYKNLDFRVSGKYKLFDGFSLKASYNKLNQYIFMMSNSISISSTNKWKLSDSHLKPMKGEQYSFGIFNNLFYGKIETSIEAYYKEIENQVEYKDGAEFITNQIPETNIIQGNLKASGIELMIKKKHGKLNGWVNYTFSKAKVKAFNTLTGEMNNRGIAYSANYDRPHAFNLALNYKATKRISFSINIVYSTGRPITYPTSIYYQNGIEIIGFSNRNQYRLPYYFRTDFAINIEGNLKKYKFAHSFWSISFYNLTSRKNPYSIVFRNENGKIKGYEIAILGTIIPSITYNLKLGNYDK